jgi:hypothetical protein
MGRWGRADVSLPDFPVLPTDSSDSNTQNIHMAQECFVLGGAPVQKSVFLILRTKFIAYLKGKKRVLYRIAPKVHCTSLSYTCKAVFRFL